MAEPKNDDFLDDITEAEAEELSAQTEEFDDAALELDSLRAERDELKDRYMRALADAENARKRGDKARREAVEAKNHAEAMVHATEKTLSEAGDKVSDDVKAPVEAALAELKTALEGDDAEDINAKMQALTEVSLKLGEELYKAGVGTEEAEGEGDETSAKADGDDVVDADFEEVDENKKDAS